MNQSRSLELFLPLSLVVHALLIVGVWTMAPKEKTYIPIEISFGAVGPVNNGGGAPKPQPKAQPKPKPAPVAKTVNTDAPVVAAKETAPTAATTTETVASTGTGEGVGDGAGTGTGVGMQGSGSSDPRALYAGKLVKLLDQNKRYPRSAKALGQEGRVLVTMTIDKSGKLLEVKLKKGCMHNSLNKASIETVKSVKKYPPIPAEIGKEQATFVIPIDYSIQL